MTDRYDIAVVGGGINGAAIARDAAGRGLRVFLAERADYANATSSASSKLVHGGIRYLEHGEFRLVRESLHERETLLAIAPHLVTPLRFLLPITSTQPRAAWKVRIGLALYDLLSGRQRLQRTGRLQRHEIDTLTGLRRNDLRAVLHYPDCWTDDARLTLSTLLDARARGAVIRNRCEVTGIQPCPAGGYRVELRSQGFRSGIDARVVVNAAGPWADRLLDRVEGRGGRPPTRLRLVRGSHIVVRTPPGIGSDAWTLQHTDGRVVFVIPWLGGRYRIIGTTDVTHEGDAASARCSTTERDYLLATVNRFFHHPLRPEDVVWDWSGVRPLVDDGEAEPSKITRDYRFALERHGDGALLTVFGGKLTTHRLLAERALDQLAPIVGPLSAPWTRTAPLAGGDVPADQLDAMAAAGPAILPSATRARLVHTYGSTARALFETVLQQPLHAREIAPGIPEVELRHAIDHEDARTADDFLFRRTKTFIDLAGPDMGAIHIWFGRHVQHSPTETSPSVHDPATCGTTETLR